MGVFLPFHFFLELMRYNRQNHNIQSIQKWRFGKHTHCERIPSIELFNISTNSHIPSLLFFFFGENTSLQFSSVQFSRSVVYDSLRPHELQHARPPCPSPSPGVHPDSRPSSPWNGKLVTYIFCINSRLHVSLELTIDNYALCLHSLWRHKL